MMRFVTTCSKRGFEDYGHRLLETWGNSPANAELHWYTEGFDIPATPRVRQRPLEQVQGLQTLKLQHADYRPPSWRWDVLKYAHKVFAAADALMGHDGIGVWIDADCVIHKEIPQGTLEEFLPAGFYMSMFRRRGMYTETGYWMVDCTHKHHHSFFMDWLNWYENAKFQNLGEWHDCMTLDATVRMYAKENLIEVFSLSGQHETEMHPMALSPLGEWIDHCKGPRKEEGVSPENPHRSAA